MENILSPTQILPQKRTVTVDGQEYVVKKDFSTGKEKVTIDGKQYNVKTGSNPLACDLPADVVIINGRQYQVRDDEMGRLQDKISYVLQQKVSKAVNQALNLEV